MREKETINKERTNEEVIDQKEMTAIPADREGQSTLDSKNPVWITIIDAAEEDAIAAPEVDTQTEAPEPGGFPVDALPELMRSLSVAVAKEHQIAPELPAMTALATLSGAIGKSAIVNNAISGMQTPCNIYVIAGAAKSYGKGASSRIAQPLLDASREMLQTFTDHDQPRLLMESLILKKKKEELTKAILSISEEGESAEATVLSKTIARIEEIRRLLKYPPSYHVGAATGPALEEAIYRNNEQLLSYSAEAGDMIKIALGAFGGSDMDLLLAGYSQDTLASGRIGRGFKSFKPCLSLLWMGQPGLLRKLYASEEVIDRGLSARVLAFCIDRDEVPTDDGVDRRVEPKLLEDWTTCITDTLARRGEPRVIEATLAAQVCFRDFYNESTELRNGLFRDVEGELGRWRENAIRIAGILAVADGADEISETMAKDAIRIGRWCSLKSLELMASGRATRIESRKERLRKLLVGGAVTIRLLNNNHGFSKAELRHIAEQNSEEFIWKKVKPAIGRPSDVMTLACNEN